MIPKHVEEKVSELWNAPTIDEWLNEQLTDEHKLLYSGIMKARCTATETFSVEFDPLIDTLGYGKKQNATSRLERDFEEGKDYALLTGKQSGRGSNAKYYALTLNCAERFAAGSAGSAETGKGKEIRDFFVRVFNVIQEYHILSLQIASKNAVHKARHEALLAQYPDGKHVHYRIWVGRQGGLYELQKAGKTNRLVSRVRETHMIYGMAYLEDVVETHYNQELEGAVKADPLISRYRESRVIQGENQTELVGIRGELTSDIFGKRVRLQLKSLVSDGDAERRHQEKLLELRNAELDKKGKMLSQLIAAGMVGTELQKTLAILCSFDETKTESGSQEVALSEAREKCSLDDITVEPDVESVVQDFIKESLQKLLTKGKPSSSSAIEASEVTRRFTAWQREKKVVGYLPHMLAELRERMGEPQQTTRSPENWASLVGYSPKKGESNIVNFRGYFGWAWK